MTPCIRCVITSHVVKYLNVLTSSNLNSSRLITSLLNISSLWHFKYFVLCRLTYSHLHLVLLTSLVKASFSDVGSLHINAMSSAYAINFIDRWRIVPSIAACFTIPSNTILNRVPDSASPSISLFHYLVSFVHPSWIITTVCEHSIFIFVRSYHFFVKFLYSSLYFIHFYIFKCKFQVN